MKITVLQIKQVVEFELRSEFEEIILFRISLFFVVSNAIADQSLQVQIPSFSVCTQNNGFVTNNAFVTTKYSQNLS